MPVSEMRLAEIAEQFEADGIAYLMVQFVDIHGAAKVKLVPAGELRTAVESGAGFAGGAVWGMGQGPHDHDMAARIDPDTYTPLPYEPGVARFAAELYVDGEPHPYCPRVNLRRVLDDARGRGFAFNVGMEPEFFLVTQRPDGSIAGWDPLGVDGLAKPCYDFQGLSAALGFLRAMNDGLQKLGWGVYQSDHEDANSQFEINFRYADALTTADRLTFFRMMAVAGRPAVRRDRHVHGQAVRRQDRLGRARPLPPGRRRDRRQPVPRRVRPPAAWASRRSATSSSAGVLAHAPALCAVASPTVNCYKRLQMGPALTGSRSGLHVDAGVHHLRRQQPDADDPHGRARATSRTGPSPARATRTWRWRPTSPRASTGSTAGSTPARPTSGTCTRPRPEAMSARGIGTLPQSLAEALDALEADAVVRSALGPIADEFLRLKRAEWREYHAQVGSWEVRRYLTAL